MARNLVSAANTENREHGLNVTYKLSPSWVKLGTKEGSVTHKILFYSKLYFCFRGIIFKRNFLINSSSNNKSLPDLVANVTVISQTGNQH